MTLKLNSVGSPQDAPAFFRLKFGEIAKEMTEDSADYDGWISRSWIQEEFIHIDVLPAELKLPRRYAFRYMEIEAIDTSMKWQMVVEDVFCTSVSSVRMEDVKPVESEDEIDPQNWIVSAFVLCKTACRPYLRTALRETAVCGLEI